MTLPALADRMTALQRAGGTPWVTLARNSVVALPSEPKEWLQLTRGGAIEDDTVDGRKYKFDLEAMVRNVNARAAAGVYMAGDPEHLHLDTPLHGRPVDAYAWFDRLELRPSPNGPQIWAHVLEYTPPGAEKIRNKLVRYVSPVFPPPADGKTITDIESVGFVLVPNMKLPQVMNRAGQGASPMDPLQALAEIAAQLGLPANTDPQKIVDAVTAWAQANGAQTEVQANRAKLAETLKADPKATVATLLRNAAEQVVALESKAAQVPALQADLAKANDAIKGHETAEKTAKIESAWDRNKARIAPAAEAAARKHCEQDPDGFEAVWKDMPLLANRPESEAEKTAREAAEKARNARGAKPEPSDIDVPREAREIVREAARNGRRMAFSDAVAQVRAKHGIKPDQFSGA